MILGTFRALSNYLVNRSTTLWTCAKLQKRRQNYNFEFRPSNARIFVKKALVFRPSFYKNEPDWRIGNTADKTRTSMNIAGPNKRLLRWVVALCLCLLLNELSVAWWHVHHESWHLACSNVLFTTRGGTKTFFSFFLKNSEILNPKDLWPWTWGPVELRSPALRSLGLKVLGT